MAEPLCCLLQPESYFLLDCDHHSSGGGVGVGRGGYMRISGDGGQRVVDEKKKAGERKRELQTEEGSGGGKKKGEKIKTKGVSVRSPVTD